MRTTLAILATCLLFSAPVAWAQATEGDPDKAKAETAKQLRERQDEVRRRLKIIEETMGRIAEIIKRTDPEKAARLKLALEQSREDGNLEAIDDIMNELDSQHWQEAMRGQKDLKAALERMLDILTDRDRERQRLKDEIDRLENLSQQLNKIIQEERDHYPETEKVADPEATLRRAAAARAKLADLLKRQKELIERTGKAAQSGELNDELAPSQERIRRDLERLGGDLERLGKQAPGLDTGKGSLDKAGKEMKKAEKKLRKDETREAVPHEKAAQEELEKLERKLEQMEEELKKIVRLPDYEELAKKQDGTSEDTDDLLKKMKQGSPPQPGQNPDGGEGTPGQREVEGAKKAMQRASRNLRSRSGRSANSDQKEALDRLEKARQELEEVLRQLREEEQLMLLDALEKRFRKMLRVQRGITKGTTALNLRVRDKDRAKVSRADRGKAKELSEGETGLAVDAEKVGDILREEGTSVVIPDVVDDLRQDLDSLALRITRLDVGEYTRRVQRDIEATLAELIQVIQEEREKRQGQGGGQGDGQEGEGEDRLLPSSAELKMLKALQVRINRRTSLFDRMARAGRTKEADLDTERGRLVKKQDTVSGLTRNMADRLNREDE